MKQLKPLYRKEECRNGFIVEAGMLNLPKEFLQTSGWELDDQIFIGITHSKGFVDEERKDPYERWELHAYKVIEMSDDEQKFYVGDKNTIDKTANKTCQEILQERIDSGKACNFEIKQYGECTNG